MVMSKQTVRCLILAAVILLQSGAIILSLQTQHYQQFRNSFVGYTTLDTNEFHQLMAEYTETPVGLRVEANPDQSQRIMHFSIPTDSTVFLSASALEAPVTHIQPLIIQREDNRRFLLPLIRSATDNRRVWNDINLGYFAAGQHTIVLSQDPAVDWPLPDSLSFRASRPTTQSLVSYFIDHSPVITLKNPANVLDDIPLISYSAIDKKDHNYQVTTIIIFSSENGGTMPVDLMTNMQRTVDVEWVTRQIFVTNNGHTEASDRIFQARSHKVEEYAGKQSLGNRPVLAVATANNNFGDSRLHFGQWNIHNPLARQSSDPIYYAPKPLFLEPQQWSKHLLELIPELQQWSLYELALEGCVDLSDATNQRVITFVSQLDYIRQHLRVVYPDRGCHHHKLPLT